MTDIEKLTEERDDARQNCVRLIIRDVVDAYDCLDVSRIVASTKLLMMCPYPEIKGLEYALALGNFVYGIPALVALKPKEDGEVLFEAKQ